MSRGRSVERFEAELRPAGGGAFLEVPFDVKEVFGSGRPPVRGTLNGTPFRGRIARMSGCWMLGLNRELRDAAGLTVGDHVAVEIEFDDEPRVVEVPGDFAHALARTPELREFFDSLSYTHRKEYVRWVEEAKRAETRASRIQKALVLLSEGTRTPD